MWSTLKSKEAVDKYLHGGYMPHKFEPFSVAEFQKQLEERIVQKGVKKGTLGRVSWKAALHRFSKLTEIEVSMACCKMLEVSEN